MFYGPAAIKRCGMLMSHGAVFEQVARRDGCVIGVRELNPLSEGLIQAGHATKGFHIKAKSCNWGPMAGFVCVDPRFSKEANTEKQQGYVNKALAAGAGKVPLFISSRRLIELDEIGLIRQYKKGIMAKRILIHAEPPTRSSVQFLAVREGTAEPLWKLYALNGQYMDVDRVPELSRTNSFEVLGLSNPAGVASSGVQPTGPKAAVAGDYDLFCVWPRFHQNRPLATKPRVMTGGSGLDARKEYLSAVAAANSSGGDEDAHMGNVSFFGKTVINHLNAGIAGTGYTGGAMVHHNDESGNPFTPGQDYPLLFFIPGQTPCAVSNDTELRTIFQQCQEAGYVVEQNAGFALYNFKAPKETTLQRLQREVR
jgi:hypothetical protein